MKHNKLDAFLNQRAQSPAPHLEADPFLPTRIAALVNEKNNRSSGFVFPQWSLASALGTFAIILGIYIGTGISETSTSYSESQTDLISEYSNAFYQSGIVDNYDNVFENGGSEND